MTTKPSVALAAIGQKITATLWNNGVYRVWQFLDVTKPVCQLTPSAVQSIPNNTMTAITFDTEAVDTDSQHSTVSLTSRVVIGNTLGWYRCSGAVGYAGSAAATRFGIQLGLNGTGINGSQHFSAGAGTATPLSAVMPPVYVQATAAADYVELFGFQQSGVAMNTTVSGAARPIFTVEYCGTLQ